MRLPIIISLAFVVSACGEAWQDNRIPFGGIIFAYSVDAYPDKPEDFRIVIKNAVQNVDASREAGQYEGTKYCVETFGTSDIEWGQGPEADPTIIKGNLHLNGSCSV